MERLKPLLALLGGAGVVLVGVVGLSSWTMGQPVGTTLVTDTTVPLPGAPADGLSPTAEGGVLEVSGDRSGRLALTHPASMNASSLEGDDGRLTFGQSEGLFVDQIVYEGLDFFPEAGECEVTVGEIDTQIGIAPVWISCVDITDLRDTATITIEGTVGLSGTHIAVVRDQLPPAGGTVTLVGGVEATLSIYWASWDEYDPDMFVGPAPPVAAFGDEAGNNHFAWAPGEEPDELTLVEMTLDNRTFEVEPGRCVIGTERLGVLSPETSLDQATIDCPDLEIGDLGIVGLTGSVVFEHHRDPSQ